MSAQSSVIRTSGNPNAAAAASSPYGSLGAPSATESKVSDKIAEERQKLNNYLSGDWESPWFMIIITVVMALIFIIVIYFTEYQAFDASGVIGGSNPGTFGNYHGVWLYLCVFLAIIGAGVTISLMYAKASEGITWGVFACLALTIFFYFALKSLEDLAKISFWVSLIVFVLACIVLAVGGVLLLRRGIKTPEELAKMDENMRAEMKRASDGLTSRASLAYGMTAVSVIFAIVSAAGLYLLSSNLTLA